MPKVYNSEIRIEWNIVLLCEHTSSSTTTFWFVCCILSVMYYLSISLRLSDPQVTTKICTGVCGSWYFRSTYDPQPQGLVTRMICIRGYVCWQDPRIIGVGKWIFLCCCVHYFSACRSLVIDIRRGGRGVGPWATTGVSFELQPQPSFPVLSPPNSSFSSHPEQSSPSAAPYIIFRNKLDWFFFLKRKKHDPGDFFSISRHFF